jgi:thioredoxin reductase (NADPH)
MIIGSGPSGLACAIEAKKSGLSAIVLEKGSITDSIRRFPHDLIWFSTPELLEIGNVPFVIPTVRPTRVDTLNYYRKVARHEQLDIRQHDAVEEILHPGDEFLVRTAGGKEYRGTSVVGRTSRMCINTTMNHSRASVATLWLLAGRTRRSRPPSTSTVMTPASRLFTADRP